MMWKFWGFSVTQILREIRFVKKGYQFDHFRVFGAQFGEITEFFLHTDFT